NKPKGFACVSCSWAKPAKPHPFEFCEEGAKATAWEITSRRCGPDFFAAHSVRELESWSDHALEESGEMLSGYSTPISSQYHQIQGGGDKAALMGVCKALFELDYAKKEERRPGVIDRAFIAEHTHGFEEFEKCVRGHNWAELELGSGLRRSAMQAAATV